MAQRPGTPVGEDGKPIIPTAVEDEDDVQGHIALSSEPLSDEELVEEELVEEDKPHLAS